MTDVFSPLPNRARIYHRTPAQAAAERAYIAAVEARWAVWLAKPDEELEDWQVWIKRNREARVKGGGGDEGHNF